MLIFYSYHNFFITFFLWYFYICTEILQSPFLLTLEAYLEYLPATYHLLYLHLLSQLSHPYQLKVAQFLDQ